MGSGTQTAGMAIGGGTPPQGSPFAAINEEYDGSSWTESADLNTARLGGGADGTNTATIAAGGDAGAGSDNNTETWDGTAWTAQAALPTGIGTQSFTVGTTASAFAGGGRDPGPTNVTAETYDWTGESAAAATVTSS